MTQSPGDGGTDPQVAGLANSAPESESLSQEEVRIVPILKEYKPYNAQKHLAEVRARITFRLIWILVGVIFSGVTLFLTAILTGVDKIANIGPTYLAVFSSTVTLVSAATGFYFGQSQGDSGKDGS